MTKMTTAIVESLKASLLFSDQEYAHWKQIIELEQKSEMFLEHVRTYMLSIHYNSSRDFILKFVGMYSHAEILLAPGLAQLTYFSPGVTQGICGMRLNVARDRIEVCRMQAQDRTMVPGLLTKIAVG